MRRDFLQAIGARLARIRGQRSQADFAPLIGIHKNTVGTYERGEREIGAEVLARLAELGWNPLWLLTGHGPERIPEGVERGAVVDRAQALVGDEQADARVRAREDGYFTGVRAGQDAQKTASQSQSHALRRDVLKVAVQLAEEALDGRTLVPADYAELVDLIYDALANGLPSAQVLAFARPAARGIGLRGDEDANPVDRPGAPVAGAGK